MDVGDLLDVPASQAHNSYDETVSTTFYFSLSLIFILLILFIII